MYACSACKASILHFLEQLSFNQPTNLEDGSRIIYIQMIQREFFEHVHMCSKEGKETKRKSLTKKNKNEKKIMSTGAKFEPTSFYLCVQMSTTRSAKACQWMLLKVGSFQALSWSQLVRKLCPVGVLIYINITVSYCRILTLKFSLKFIHHAGAVAAAAGK